MASTLFEPEAKAENETVVNIVPFGRCLRLLNSQTTNSAAYYPRKPGISVSETNLGKMCHCSSTL